MYQENAISFDQAIFKEILCSERPATAPRSVFIRPDEDAMDASPPYLHNSCIFSSSDLGTWNKRGRLYAAYHMGGGRVQVLQNDCRFEDHFKRPMNTGAGYLVADEAMVKFELGQRLEAARVRRAAFDDSFKPEEAALSNGDFGRLEGWRLKAHKARLRDESGVWVVPMALGNVSQNDSYWGRLATVLFPSVLPRAVYYDFVRDRAITISEVWLSMGWPHPDYASLGEDTAFFPYPSLVSMTSQNRLSLNAQRALLGNGMHLAAIGSWYFYQHRTTRVNVRQ